TMQCKIAIGQAIYWGATDERRAVVADCDRGVASVPGAGGRISLDDRHAAPGVAYARRPLVRRCGRRSHARDAAHQRAHSRHHRGAAGAVALVRPHAPAPTWPIRSSMIFSENRYT